MAKGDRPQTREVGADDDVKINLADPTTFATPNFSVEGTAIPTNATVSGILTNTITATTIASNPATAPCTGINGDWTLHFQNVPPGTYILGVNEQGENEGADAKNVVVSTAATLTIGTITPGSTTATVPVTNNNPSPLTVSVVITTSPPKHGKPKHKKLVKDEEHAFKFTDLPSNKEFTVTAYAIKGLAQGAVKKGKTTA